MGKYYRTESEDKYFCFLTKHHFYGNQEIFEGAAYRIVADAGTIVDNTRLGSLDETVSTRRSTFGHVAMDGADTAVGSETDGCCRFAGRHRPGTTRVDEYPAGINLCCCSCGGIAYGLRDGFSPFER